MPLSVRISRFGRVGAGQIGWTIAAGIALGSVLGASDVVLAPFAVIGAVALLAFGLSAPAAFVMVFLFARPLLDDYSSKGSSGVTPGGLLGVLVIVVAVAFALTRKRLQMPRATYGMIILFLL